MLYLWQIDLIRRCLWHSASRWLGVYHLHNAHPADVLAAQVSRLLHSDHLWLACISQLALTSADLHAHANHGTCWEIMACMQS